MPPTPQQRAILERVAHRLGSLLDRVAFVGGGIVPLLITDPAADPVRATDDVDLIVEVASTMASKTELRDQLIAQGFSENPADKVLWRWKVEGITVEFMPTDPTVLGLRTNWYRPALSAAVRYPLTETLSIPTISAPNFIATKLEAFEDRGKGDHRASHDIEDVIAVIDGRPELAREFDSAPTDGRAFVRSHLTTPQFQDAAPLHLGYGSDGRAPILRGRIADLLRA